MKKQRPPNLDNLAGICLPDFQNSKAFALSFDSVLYEVITYFREIHFKKPPIIYKFPLTLR